MATATATTSIEDMTLDQLIDHTRAIITRRLAKDMRAAALAAIEATDFDQLAGEALEGIDIGDCEAVRTAGAEALSGRDWEMSID